VNKGKRIEPEEWWERSDDLGGIRQSTVNPSIYFLVSKSNIWQKDKEYIPPTGYRWISTEEGRQIFNSNPMYTLIGINGQKSTITYKNLGGWRGYVWNGIKRVYFMFNDSRISNLAKHAGSWDSAALYTISSDNLFAGIVCKKITD